MQYVRDSFWRGRSFASLTDMQTRAISWCREVAGVRAHRSLDGASPLAVFDALEAPALLALPARPFELARWLSPKVAPDCHIMVDKVPYSVSWAYVGARTDTRVSETPWRCTSLASWSRPGPRRPGAAAPTRRTIHRRRSLSSPGIRSGAGPDSDAGGHNADAVKIWPRGFRGCIHGEGPHTRSAGRTHPLRVSDERDVGHGYSVDEQDRHVIHGLAVSSEP